MEKLVKRVKLLESKLKARGRNVILSDSDNEEDEAQDVDSLIKLAKAAAFAADTSSVPADATQATGFPPSSSIHTDAFVHGNDVPSGTDSTFSADPSNKGKSPMLEEDPPIKERSFRQMEEDRLGAEAARKLYEEEQAELARVQEEMKKKRQEDVINSAKYYNDDDWSDIMGQVHANKGLTADLLGPDVNEDNFAARMATIIADRRRKFAAQSSAIYSTGWTLKYVKTFTDDQLKAEFDKIRNAAADLQAQNLRRSLKRPGVDVEQPGSKKSKSSAAPQTPVPAATHQSSAGVTPDVHQSPFVDTPPHSPKASSHPDVTPDTSVDPTVAPTPPFATLVSRSSGPRTRSQSFDADIKTYNTKRKSLAPRKMPSSEVDLHAPDTSFITVLSDDVSDASDDDTDPLFWHIFAAWEVIPTGLGDVNALYFTDKTSKYFTHLREILHLIDRQDLSKLYGLVVKHYEVNPLAGNRLILWGDLHVLFESTTGGSSVEVWNDQQEWVIHSWKLFPFSGVHVLETFVGKILYMFLDTPYPLSASLMKKILKHKLEVEIDGIGNDMTHAVQLIQFFKNQLASCTVRWFLRSINLVAAVFVAVSILKALKTEDLSRKLEVNYVKFQFRGGLLGLKDLSRAETYKWYQSLVALDLGFNKVFLFYLLYGSAGGRVITAAGGRSYKENSSSWFLLVVPAGRLCGSYWSAYGFFCLPCPILFVIAASIIVYLLYGSAGVRVITAAGGRSYKENSRFKRKVATGIWQDMSKKGPTRKRMHVVRENVSIDPKAKEMKLHVIQNVDSEETVMLRPRVDPKLNGFGKCFVPQRELSDEQALHHITDQSASSPVKIEAHRELPKVSLVNTSLKKLKYHLGQFDNVVKKWITPNALTEGEWEFKHTKAVFQNEIIPFLKTLKDIFNVFDKDLLMRRINNFMEQAAILREVVEQAKLRNPLDSASYSAFAVTPINKKKTVRFADIITSSGNIPKVTNRHVLSSTGVNPSTSASGSKPSGNTKNDRISRTPSSNEKNKVEVQSRKVKSSLNKRNSESKNVCNEHVKHPVKGVKALCSVCNECLFDANHAMCLIDYVNSMNVVQIVLWYLDFGCSKHMTGDRSQLANFVHKFLGTVKFSHDQVAKIMGYGDYQIGNVTISRVYYVEGLGHNLFSVGSRGTNLYSLSNGDIMTSSPICLLSKARKTKSCKKQSHKSKSEDTNQEKLYLLHMDLYGPMCVASVNGKKYILIIVDDYSQFTWVKFLASKDEAPDFIIKFLKMIQVRLNAIVKNIRTYNGTEFLNQTLRDFYEQVCISHETSVARTPQQNDVVERRNRTLVEAARTMLIFAQAPLFLWAEAVATACYTQNRSIIRRRHGKTPYELLHDRKPDLSYLYVFGALCYPNNDSENLGKLQAKVDIGLVPNPPPSSPFVPPSRHEWDLVFQLVFDEFFSPPASVASPVPVESTGSPSSITVDQDAPSPKESHDLEDAHMSNDPYFGILIPEIVSEESSSSDVISTTVHSDAPISKHLSKWTKDHP
ncbi:retrovirus-related pol polyprotein from transposon TNT 1-94 [Tanacetum coccineum]